MKALEVKPSMLGKVGLGNACDVDEHFPADGAIHSRHVPSAVGHSQRAALPPVGGHRVADDSGNVVVLRHDGE